MLASALLLVGSLLLAQVASVGVCIFDIDDTLNRGWFASASRCGVSQLPATPKFVATFGAQAVQGCLDNGFAIAIASAEPAIVVNVLGRKDWLNKVNPNFNDTFFATPAFQFGSSDKAPMIKNIMSYFNIVDVNCAVLYDDASVNGKAAAQVGIHWVMASAACQGNQLCPTACGLGQSEFNQGVNMLKTSCTQL